MLRRTSALLWLGIVAGLLSLLTSCGGSAPSPSVAVTASATTVDGTDSVTLSASVTNDRNGAGVNWTVSGPGTLSNTTTAAATYTAPAATNSSQTATITATSVADSSKTGTATITIPAAPSITSTSANLAGAVGTAYSVSLQASGGIPPFTWALAAGTTLPACLTLKSNGTLTTASGTAPTASCAGNYTNLTFKATDSGTPTPLSVTSSPLTITITAPTIAFAPALPGGNVGAAYMGSVAATGVLGTSTYTIASGSLPADLSLNSSTGAISGTPKAADAGTASFTVMVTDAYGDTATSGGLSITIAAAPAITFTGSVPTTGTYGLAYSGSAAATGGAGALTYSISAGALPPDLPLNASTGAITGTPSKVADVGSFSFTVKAADAFGDSATEGYALTISYPSMSVSQSSLPTGYVAGLYNQATLSATGGTGVSTNYSWQVTSGALPGGLSLSTAGVISGTLMNTDATGTYSFTVKVTDTVANLSATGSFSIVVDAGVSITTATLPTGYVGSSYSVQLAATGGTGAGYQWIVTGGTNLPSGLTLSLSGLLSGTPANPGTSSVTFNVVDSTGNSATATLSIAIDAGITINAPPLASAYPATSYTSAAFTASGGSGTGYMWSWAAASGSTLPNGLSIGSSTGVISGTPVNTGTSTVTSSVVVTATDSVGNRGSVTVSIGIEATLVVTSPSTLPGVTTGVNPNYALTAGGGSGTYTGWTVTSGASSLTSLGLAVSANGVLSGANPQAGTASFSVTVTDSQGHVSAAATLSVTVSNTVTITTTSINSLDVGQTATQTLTAAGGSGITADYSWSWTAASGSSLPPGLSLSTGGAISGTPTTAGSYTVTVTVKDTGITPNQTAQQNFTITIYGVLSLPAPNPSSLPAGYVGVSYSGSVTGSGGSGNVSLAVTSAPTPADGLTATPSGATVNISGSPTANDTVTFSVKLTDDSVSNSSITQTYTINVTTPTAPSLPTPSTSIPGSGTVGTPYTGSISASGGVGPTYTWTVNGTTVSGSLALSDGLSVNSSGSSTLSITGTPTTVNASGVQFTASVKDNTTGLTSSTQTYTVVVNAAGSQVSGMVTLQNNCGGGTQPTFTVSVYNGSTLIASGTTDSSGNYSIGSIPDGTYTIIPSIPAASSSLFSPINYAGVTLSSSGNNNVTGENFNAEVGYTVSGAVSYSGSEKGWTYLTLNNNNCGGNGGPGTSVSEATLTSGGAFTIRGVPPGSYTLSTWMDPIAQGVQNAIDPTGGNTVTVTDANITTAGVALFNPTYATPTENPQIEGVIPNPQGVLIEFNESQNSNGVEDANQYTVEWSTSPTLGGGSDGTQFATVTGSHTFAADGNNSALWNLSNAVIEAGLSNGSSTGSGFTAGQTYYFQARSFDTLASTTHPSGWCNYTSGGCSGTTGFTGVTIATPACSGTCTSVTGSVTIPAGITIKSGATLYLGLVEFSSSGTNGGPTGIYVTGNTSPVSGANSFTVDVPSGSNYGVVGFLDQNNVGRISGPGVPGDANDSLVDNLTISGSSQTVAGINLPTSNSLASMGTQFTSSNCQGCSTSTSYQLSFEVEESDKLPVAVTLNSGPNLLNSNGTVALDMSVCTSCGNAQFDYSATLPGGTPAVGDTYDFTVTYADGSQDTGSAVNAAVTGWNGGDTVVDASDLPTDLAPQQNNSSSLTPTFTWTDPAASQGSNFDYSFYLYNQSGSNCSNGDIWQIPGNNSNSNGFSSSITSITWGTDPTGGGSTPCVSGLTSGDEYNWSIQVQDQNKNQAQTQVWYQP